MSKTITSPLKRWPGSVVISDPMTILQVEAFENGLEVPDGIGESKNVFLTVMDKPQILAILACVEKWVLLNFPESPTIETFPMTPRAESHKLIEWLYKEIMSVYIGEVDVPNE